MRQRSAIRRRAFLALITMLASTGEAVAQNNEIEGPIDMVEIAGGTFTMGDTISTRPSAELRPHQVTVST